MKISVELDEEMYSKLSGLKGHVTRAGSYSGLYTHAAIFRAALELLLQAKAAAENGDVVGVAKGRQQRVRKVLTEPRWNGVVLVGGVDGEKAKKAR